MPKILHLFPLIQPYFHQGHSWGYESHSAVALVEFVLSGTFHEVLFQFNTEENKIYIKVYIPKYICLQAINQVF